MTEAPQLKNHLFKAFLTLFRSKKLKSGDYSSESEFIVSNIRSSQLNDYSRFFHFNEALPLSYLYLVCQGIHTSQMVAKDFPLPLPGMVHLASNFESIADINPDLPITIKSIVSIEDKERGSLIPIFKDEFFQNGSKIVVVKSTYLVKRKRKGKPIRKKEEKLEKEYDNWISFIWKIPGNMGIKYAKLSGDFNPIHLISLFAWFFGFKRKIIQGWYLASRAVAEVEKDTNMPAKSLHINFKKGVYLPSKSIFEFRLSNERNLHFRLVDEKKEITFISGNIS